MVVAFVTRWKQWRWVRWNDTATIFEGVLFISGWDVVFESRQLTLNWYPRFWWLCVKRENNNGFNILFICLLDFCNPQLSLFYVISDLVNHMSPQTAIDSLQKHNLICQIFNEKLFSQNMNKCICLDL